MRDTSFEVFPEASYGRWQISTVDRDNIVREEARRYRPVQRLGSTLTRPTRT